MHLYIFIYYTPLYISYLSISTWRTWTCHISDGWLPFAMYSQCIHHHHPHNILIIIIHLVDISLGNIHQYQFIADCSENHLFFRNREQQKNEERLHPFIQADFQVTRIMVKLLPWPNWKQKIMILLMINFLFRDKDIQRKYSQQNDYM